jgi:glycosyltransferase involved in cell wall biosynthesis
MDNHIRVMISTHLGPPLGGPATRYGDLFRSRFAELVQLHYVDHHPRAFSFSRSGQISQSNLASVLTYYAHFVMLLLRVKPHVVHIATSEGLSFLKQGIAVALARMSGARVVLAPHFSYERLLLRNGLWGAYHRFVLRRCNGLIALSKEWLVLRQWLPGCLIEYLPNAIDLKPYRDLPRPRADGDDQVVRILFLGHIGRDKGSFDLVEAARQLERLLPTASWQIELRGEELLPGDLEKLQQLINESGLQERVHIRPPVFNADKVACLASTDLFILPSYHEGMPISVLEAMASSLPVVATHVGGLPDLVADGENGLLVSPGQPGELAEALAELIGDPGRRMRMGLSGRQRALERHDLDALVPDLVRFHERVASGSW